MWVAMESWTRQARGETQQIRRRQQLMTAPPLPYFHHAQRALPLNLLNQFVCSRRDDVDEFLGMCRVTEATGVLEQLVRTQMAPAARKIKATFCPSDDVTEPEYVAMGGENTGEHPHTRETTMSAQLAADVRSGISRPQITACAGVQEVQACPISTGVPRCRISVSPSPAKCQGGNRASASLYSW